MKIILQPQQGHFLWLKDASLSKTHEDVIPLFSFLYYFQVSLG